LIAGRRSRYVSAARGTNPHSDSSLGSRYHRRVELWRALGGRVGRTACVAALGFALQLASIGRAFGEEKPPEHAPLPEPLFNETMTDIDGDEPGEVELEANAFRRRALRRTAYAMQGTVEVEWLATRHLGLFVEPVFSQWLDVSGARAHDRLGLNAGASWKLLQDFQHAFHLQAELGARYPLDPSLTTDPGDSALPFALDLRAAFRRGAWTLRASAGAEAGGGFAHVPARASFGVFLPFAACDRYGFWGIEADADGGRRYPAVVALNFLPSLIPLGVPFKIGLAIPWAVGVPATQPVVGVLLRLFVEGEREVSYTRHRMD
jgi:hypothetical protein